MHATLCFLSYNRAEFLASAITTAVDNAGYPVEVIVHDDGSTEGDDVTTDMLREFQEDGYVSTLILNRPGHNEGQGVALNRMFSIATGDYIVKLDQDLIFFDNWLRQAVDILEKDTEIGLLGLFRYEHDPVDYRKTEVVSVTPQDDTYTFHTHICGSGFVVPRGVWEELGPFAQRSPAFSEDWEFQRAVAEGWYNALPTRDLVQNRGFGIGPSTIVNPGNKITKIQTGPYIIERR
jgi:glycosyltransferase involved in cell wall biosynthesis